MFIENWIAVFQILSLAQPLWLKAKGALRQDVPRIIDRTSTALCRTSLGSTLFRKMIRNRAINSSSRIDAAVGARWPAQGDNDTSVQPQLEAMGAAAWEPRRGESPMMLCRQQSEIFPIVGGAGQIRQFYRQTSEEIRCYNIRKRLCTCAEPLPFAHWKVCKFEFR